LKIDFAKIDFTKRPTFILRNMEGTALKILSHALNPNGTFSYMDVSEIMFDYPAQVDGEALEEYDLLTDMRILDVQNYGQFLLRNPVEKDNGISKIKSCHFYSLESEFMNKMLELEEGTYNFWNPLATDGTIIGMILEEMPSWSIGSISTDLIGKYRTFSVDNTNIYDFIRSTAQKTYGCVFDFDTYNRKIYVRSVNDGISIKPVYLSTKNLIKDIEVSYQTEDIVTVLDVYGADGVDIRSVNPMGINKIYNLDRYMNEEYFSASMVSKWNSWKTTFESYQQTYYDLVIEQQMQISRYQTEAAALGTLNGEMQTLEKQRAVIIQAIATDTALQSDLDTINSRIRSKQSEIDAKNSLLTTIKNGITTLNNRLKAINQATAFSTFFSASEIKQLDKYFRCGRLTDSSFVAASVDSYATDSTTKKLSSAIFNLTDLTTLRAETHDAGKTFYTVRGGKIQESGTDFTLNAQIVRGTLQVNSDNSFIFSLYLNTGTINSTEFPSATLSMTGTMMNVTTGSSSLQFKVSSTTAYLTQAVTEYQRMSIEWELYEYAKTCLDKLSVPTYSFSVDCANFFVLDDFLNFAKQFTLGEKIYLHMGDTVLNPIVVGVTLEFDDPTTLELNFGDQFRANNQPITFEDFLDQSISMGSTLDFNQFNYSSWVNTGANTSVQSFMKSAIDTMKNAIMSGDHNEMTIDPTGLRMRRYDESKGDYDPRQIWMNHNSIMFTKDNWQSAEIGIGEFVDDNLGSLFGIVAPALVGTILAGSQLIIESEKTDGGVVVFKVDAEGASLHNASFNLYGSSGGRIDLGATYGLVAGGNKNMLFYYDSEGQPTGVRTDKNRSISRINQLQSGESPNANLWFDMYGDAYFKGKVIATSGEFSGELKAASGTFTGALNGATGNFTGIVKASDFQIGDGTTFTSIMRTVNGQKYMAFDGKYISNLNAGSITAGKLDAQYINTSQLVVGTNIAMGSNAYIAWDHVNGYEDVEQDIADAKSAGTAAESIAKKIVEGTYSGGSFISNRQIYSPTIYSDEFIVQPTQAAQNNQWKGGFTLKAYYGNELREMMKISYFNSNGYVPTVIFGTGSISAWGRWTFPHTDFQGSCSFNESVNFSSDVTFTGTVKGITATFG